MSKVCFIQIGKLLSNLFKLQDKLILKVATQICLDEPRFKQLEQDILNQVMDVSKAILETFKFKMIYDLKVTPEQKKKTLAHLKEFSENNWDKTLSRKEAYEKYVNLY